MTARTHAATSMSPVQVVRGFDVRALRGVIKAAGVDRPLVTPARSLSLLGGLLLLTRPSAAPRRAAGRAPDHHRGHTAGALT